MKNEVTVDNLLIENAALKAELSEVRQKLSWLMEQLSSSKRKLYGVSSEKSVYDGICEQTSLFPDDRMEVISQVTPPDISTPSREKPRKQGN
jgi:hypothetical protein